jgi:hypothetical protein
MVVVFISRVKKDTENKNGQSSTPARLTHDHIQKEHNAFEKRFTTKSHEVVELQTLSL